MGRGRTRGFGWSEEDERRFFLLFLLLLSSSSFLFIIVIGIGMHLKIHIRPSSPTDRVWSVFSFFLLSVFFCETRTRLVLLGEEEEEGRREKNRKERERAKAFQDVRPIESFARPLLHTHTHTHPYTYTYTRTRLHAHTLGLIRERVLRMDIGGIGDASLALCRCIRRGCSAFVSCCHRRWHGHMLRHMHMHIR